MYTLMAYAVVKYYRASTNRQFLSDLFFTVKIALIASYFFVDFRISIIYAVACLAVWLLFSEPTYDGPTQMLEIESMEQFEEIVGVTFKDDANGDIVEELNKRYLTKNQNKKYQQTTNYKQTDMVFAEFYVDWAQTCQHTKEIWADFSNKFQTKQLKFISVDLQKIPRLSECYRINTSGVSRQLPTLILFENGEEALRFPPIDQKTRKIAKVLKYAKKELLNLFNLDKRYLATRDL
ncbi:hypothetical protein pb186bvf_016529 [Paramecium bursaria]